MNQQRAYAPAYPPHVGAHTVLMGPAPLPPTPRLPTVSLPGAAVSPYLSPPDTPLSLPRSAPAVMRSHLPSPPPSLRSSPPSLLAALPTFGLHKTLIFTFSPRPILPCHWDVRRSLSTIRHATGQPLSPDSLSRPASNPVLQQATILVPALPRASYNFRGSGAGGAVLVQDFLKALFELLYSPLSSSDVAGTSSEKLAVAQSYAKRRGDSVVRRMDWLGEHTLFLGFSTCPQAPCTFEVHFAQAA